MTTIALFGSTGRIGQRILHEALARGHKVTAIVRDATRASGGTPNLEFKPGDISETRECCCGHERTRRPRERVWPACGRCQANRNRREVAC